MALIHQFIRAPYASSPLLLRFFVPVGTWELEHAELGGSGAGSAGAFIQIVREGSGTTLRDGQINASSTLQNSISYQNKVTLEHGDEVRGTITNGTVGDLFELDVFIRRLS